MLGPDQPLVEVDGFTGPFDLLVRLIERRELSLLAISLAEVTDQYLASLSASNLRDPEHLSAFLVVAAKLVLIKSTLLLPGRERPQAPEPEPADPTDLTERLKVYGAYRAVANALGARIDVGLRSYPHPPVAYRSNSPREPMPLDVAQLADAYRRARARPRESEAIEIPTEARMTVAEAMDLLRHALDQLVTVQFFDVVGKSAAPQRYVATFLAVLELARIGVASVEQTTPFGAITVARRAAEPNLTT
jgi:segregation and condensation protein A